MWILYLIMAGLAIFVGFIVVPAFKPVFDIIIPEAQSTNMGDFGNAFLGFLPFAIIIIFIAGAIYMGMQIFTKKDQQ